MAIKSPYARRDIEKLQPDILGRYHDLLMSNNLPGYEELLTQYQPHLTSEEKKELLDDFTRDAEELLRRRWRRPKFR